MHLRVEITRNWHAAWVQVRIHAAWLVTDIRLICRPDLSSSLLLKSKVKVLIAMILRSNYSLFLFFSQNLRHHQWFPMVLPNFLNNCAILQDLVEHVDNQKRFQQYSSSFVYFAAFQFRGSTSVITAQRERINSLSWFLIMLRGKFFQSSFFYIRFLTAAYSQFFNFSATSCIAFLMKMIFRLHFATQVGSPVQLALISFQ